MPKSPGPLVEVRARGSIEVAIQTALREGEYATRTYADMRFVARSSGAVCRIVINVLGLCLPW